MKKERVLTKAAFQYAADRFGNEKLEENGVSALEQYACREGFAAGAYWQKEQLWHDNSEIPDRNLEGGNGELIIVEEDNGKYSIGNVRFTGCSYYVACANYWVSIANVVSWAYMSDLKNEES